MIPNTIIISILIYVSINHKIGCDGGSPFHDLTNIPINDHDVTSTNSSDLNKTDSTSSNASNQFFDLTKHSSNDSSSSNHTYTSPDSVTPHQTTDTRCELITLPMCKGIGYNHTKMPNHFNHETQDEAGSEVHPFYALVEINCSDDLRLFLCLLYAPVCMDEYSEFVPPCRSVCERARKGCEPIMMNYKFAWAKSMNCEQFPVHGSGSICIDKKIQSGTHGGDNEHTITDMDNSIFNLGNIPIIEDKEQHDLSKDRKKTNGATMFDLFPEHSEESEQVDQISKKKKANKRIKTNQKTNHKSSSIDEFNEQIDHENNHNFISSNCKCECKRPFIPIHHLNDKRYFNRIVTGNQMNCAMPCKSPYFSSTERKVAILWITFFSFVCSFCTLITLLTFISNTQRFQYPERCIIFLSVCYLMVSSGFLVRLYVGHESVACDVLINDQQLNQRIGADSEDIHSITKTSDMLTLIRYENTGQIPGYCLIIFWLLYYFGMCACVWWVLLTFTWFLQAALKWSNEAIDSYSQYFHLVAWFTPAIKAIIIISIGAIDGDPLTGICYVGNLNDTNLLIFVIIPLCSYLVIGTLFLFAGFYSLFRIRSVLRQQIRSKTDKLEKLMVRIVIFSVLYIISGVIVIMCHIYEYYHRQNWALSHNCQCKSSSYHEILSEDSSGVKMIHFSNETPMYIVFLIKYMMYLIVSITSGFWICSGKTLDSWIRFYGRFCCFYCFGTCKPKNKVTSRETLRQSNNSMAAHLMSNIRQDSYSNQQANSGQPLTNGSQHTNNSNRAYKMLNQQQQIQQQFGAHLGLAGLKSLSSSNNGSSSTSHCKLPLSHV